MTPDVDYDMVGYVISSRYRMAVLEYFAMGGAGTPSGIADAYDVDIAHISRALQELREKDVVELLVSEERSKGRLYALCDGSEALRDEALAVGGTT